MCLDNRMATVFEAYKWEGDRYKMRQRGEQGLEHVSLSTMGQGLKFFPNTYRILSKGIPMSNLYFEKVTLFILWIICY